MRDWPAIAYVLGGMGALGFTGGAVVSFYEAVLAAADPRAFWLGVFALCVVGASITLPALVVSYARSIRGRERRTFTYTLRVLLRSDDAVERAAAKAAIGLVVFFALALAALVADLATCLSVCP